MQPADAKVIAAARRAADAWRAAMRVQRASRAMPPWDEMVFCDIPVTTRFDLLANASTPVLLENPRRVAIGFCVGGAALGTVFVRPSKEVVQATPTGIIIVPNVAQQTYTQADCLNLTQVEWYAMSVGGAATLHVMEILLRTWPKE